MVVGNGIMPVGNQGAPRELGYKLQNRKQICMELSVVDDRYVLG